MIVISLMALLSYLEGVFTNFACSAQGSRKKNCPSPYPQKGPDDSRPSLVLRSKPISIMILFFLIRSRILLIETLWLSLDIWRGIKAFSFRFVFVYVKSVDSRPPETGVKQRHRWKKKLCCRCSTHHDVPNIMSRLFNLQTPYFA